MSTKCPICKAIVMVEKRKGIKTSLLRAYALADHVRTLHGPTCDFETGDGRDYAPCSLLFGHVGRHRAERIHG